MFGICTPEEPVSSFEIEHETGIAKVLFRGRDVVLIRHEMLPAQTLGPQRFDVYPCATGFSAASEITELRIGPDRNTFGYVFPVSCYSNEVGEDREFALAYAEAGFRKFVTIENLKKFENADSTVRSNDAELEVGEAFSDFLSVLVVSKEVLQQHNVSSLELELILKKELIHILSTDKDRELVLFNSDFRAAINFLRPRQRNEEDVEKFGLLMRNADRDNSPIGQFIQYYQIFEFLILKIFDWSIVRACSAGITPWELKSRLTSVSSEKTRLMWLDRFFIPDTTEREKFVALSQQCKNLLSSIGDGVPNQTDWPSLLYALRNRIVHNHLAILTPDLLEQLSEVNRRLRDAALAAYFCFEFPENVNIFANDVQANAT